MRGPGKGKSNNPKGKPPGALNRTTKEAKELLEKVLFGQLDNITAAFEALKSDPARYIDAYAKMFGYVMPKKTDITSDNEKIQIKLPDIIIKSNGD